MEEYIHNCQLNGLVPRCELRGELVNLSTVNFYMNQIDAVFEDLGRTFVITWIYNSLIPYFYSEFGMGWNSLAGKRIIVLEDGSIL